MEKLDFSTAFKYPFNRWKGLLNILWVLLPIFGWFAIMGYQIRLVNEWIDGKFEELPLFHFVDDMKLGFIMFIKFIPFILVLLIGGWILGLAKALGTLVYLILVFLAVPILAMNFFRKQTVQSCFEFNKVRVVTSNLGDYIMVLIMSILLAIVFGVLSLILVGIPASTFTKNIFLADFYRRLVK